MDGIVSMNSAYRPVAKTPKLTAIMNSIVIGPSSFDLMSTVVMSVRNVASSAEVCRLSSRSSSKGWNLKWRLRNSAPVTMEKQSWSMEPDAMNMTMPQSTNLRSISVISQYQYSSSYWLY